MSLSLPALQAAFAQQTDELFLTCITLTHPSMSAPLRLVNDSQNLVRAAGTFVAFPFEAVLPPSRDDEMPQVVLTFANVDRDITDAIDGLTSSVAVTVEVVLASSPDTIEAGPFALTLKDVNFNAVSVDGTVGYEDLLNEPFPGGAFTPSTAPNLFA